MPEAQPHRSGLRGFILAAALSTIAAAVPAVDEVRPSLSGDPALVQGWHVVPITAAKPLTHYTWLRSEGGSAELQAVAHSSASLLVRDEVIDLKRLPRFQAQWRVVLWPVGADNRQASREDSAARIVLMFDGDTARLPLSERLKLRMASALSGHESPYATLMYVVSPTAPVGTHLANPRTDRIRMIVAANPDRLLQQWGRIDRDVAQDFRDAFGEEPGRLRAWGVMTDSDNTHTDAEGRYRDMHFVPAAAPH